MATEPLFRRYRRFWRPDPRRDVDEELAFHIAMRVEELTRAGMSEDDAREATMKRFGDFAQVREECHELGEVRAANERRADWWDAFRQDLRFTGRTMASNRAFAVLICALTMGVGIGANTAVFSVAYGVLLRPLPFHDAASLVRLWSKKTERGLDFFSVSPADYASWRQAGRVFRQTAAFERQHDATLTRGSSSEWVQGTAVTPDIFPLLGTAAYRGRTLEADDARAGASKAAVISHALWSTRFGSDAAVVGSVVSLDGSPVTIVGVMPPHFEIPGTPAQIWTALDLSTASVDHGNRFLRVLARLAPGSTIEQARTEMDLIASRLATAFPATNSGWSVNIVSVPEVIVGKQFTRALVVLLGVVAFVLLIACANAANLQLARAAARRHEIAIRTAFGAARGRLVRQLLTESVVLCVVAGAVGLLLAYGGLAVLRAVGESTVPRLETVRLDGPVLVFTALVALGSGILFGLVPALYISRTDPGVVLKTARRGNGGGSAGQGLRSALVIAEVSLSLMLLIGAGLLLRSSARLQSVDLGFDPHGLSVAPVRLPNTTYADAERAGQFFENLLARTQSLAGVTSAALVSSAPFAGVNSGLVYVAVDQPVDTRGNAPDADYRVISPGYVQAVGIRLVRGREFTAQDRQGADSVMLVSETLARRTWPGEDVIGKRVRVSDIIKGPMFTIVGVVGDARYQSLETPEVRPMMYFSSLASPQKSMALIVRGNTPASLATELRRVVASIDPGLPAPTVTALEDFVGDATATARFALVLFGIFAGAALVLASVGIYGVMSYLVRQRTHELGIRIALGAPSRTLLGSVVGTALRLTVVGVGIGLLGAWGLSRSMSALLFGVSATDPGTFAAVAVLLTVVAALGSLVPAWRATRADPLTALRSG